MGCGFAALSCIHCTDNAILYACITFMYKCLTVKDGCGEMQKLM